MLGVAGSTILGDPAEARVHVVTGCPVVGSPTHCYSLGKEKTPTFISAAGADLTAYCLGFTNGQDDDFVTYELWVLTGGGGWVEEGIVTGHLYDDLDNPISSGTQWFWAENSEDGKTYREHFIAQESLPSQTHNVAIYYAGSGHWDVYWGGVYQSTSGVSGYAAWEVESGMESTTTQGYVAGISNNFSYIDGGGPHPVHPIPSQDTGTWLYLNTGYVNGGMNPCYAAAVTSAAAPLAALRMTQTAYRQTLSDIARTVASANGEAKPSKISFSKTTRRKANQALGSKVNDDTDVYLVQVTGKFVAHQAKVPAGKAIPTGSSMTLTVDASTGQILDWGVTENPQDISILGTASSL